MSGAATKPGLTILYPSVKMATGLFYFIYFSLFVIFFKSTPLRPQKREKELSQKSYNNTVKSHAAVIVGSNKYMIVDF